MSETKLNPKTRRQREYVARWNVSADVHYGATCVRRMADEMPMDEEGINARANMRALARRLNLLARALNGRAR